jgi:alkanesulfonate monooxygenase SsuD/methylene tetrahydromethanopterin reductase-like flavin-dependent oxidoreductase (luciferase family)
MPVIARLGAGLLVIPQKPWPQVEADLAAYRAAYADAHPGVTPPAPIVAAWVFCDPDESRAAELGRRYIGGYYQSVIDHYEFRDDYLAKAKGYEFYGGITQHITRPGGADAAIDFFMDLQVWGTPEQCFRKVIETRERLGSDHLVCVFSFAGMPGDEAERNMRLFASEVAPRLRALEPVVTTA